MSLEHRLATLLWTYEMDEPHVDEDRNGHYPVISWGELEAALNADHFGDCTNECTPCIRCHAEHIWHKAKWIAGELA